MANYKPETVPKYEVLFALRTGVTILLPKTQVFDCGVENPPVLRLVSGDILVESSKASLVIPGLQKDYLDEAVNRGFVMFYETIDDEVVRCTPCHFRT